jgi:hypothetical protein
MEEPKQPELGTKVRHSSHKEEGVVEGYNSKGTPLVRWSYGNLTATPVTSLETEQEFCSAT